MHLGGSRHMDLHPCPRGAQALTRCRLNPMRSSQRERPKALHLFPRSCEGAAPHREIHLPRICATTGDSRSLSQGQGLSMDGQFRTAVSHAKPLGIDL